MSTHSERDVICGNSNMPFTKVEGSLLKNRSNDWFTYRESLFGVAKDLSCLYLIYLARA
jgi:hypothetical protein